MPINLNLPKRDGTNDTESIEFQKHIVITGANGSGKTRMGVRIEQLNQNARTVHRISAQKALNLPEFANIRNLEQAQKELIFGRSDDHANVAQKVNARWGSNPVTFLLSDFELVLSLLFAKNSERDRNYVNASMVSEIKLPVPKSPIDIITEIWAEIMPHREILFNDGKVIVKHLDSPSYHGKQMSDGERVTLYLLGQCLCAPIGTILIIDEPEIHLHRSLMDKLWNKIEELCPSQTIIYITHDLDFAATRTDSNKIWIKSHDGNSTWIWDDVPSDENLPESLILEVLGSRKRIIFCEGEIGSLDSIVYQLTYPKFHVIPRGSCFKVIESTKALRSNNALHHMNAIGIIDSDYRSEEEIQSLLANQVHTIKIAEIENMFCVEPVIRIISEHLALDVELIVKNVKDFIIDALNGELEVQVSSMAAKRIEYLLGAYSKTTNDKAGLHKGLENTLSRINIDQIYSDIESEYKTAIESNNLDLLLRVYNRKSLTSRVSPILGLKNSEYTNLFLRLLKSPLQHRLIEALQTYLPQLE